MDSAPIPLSAFLSTSCFRCFSPFPSSTTPSPNTSNPSPSPFASSATSPAQPLKRCSGCKRVRYCSPRCASLDWADHKPLCKSLSAVRRTLAPFPALPAGASAEEVGKRREKMWSRWAEEDDLLQAGMGIKRGLTPTEGQLLWRERRCGVCWAREGVDGVQQEGEGKGGWRACEGACGGMVGWCCKAHEEVGRGRHVEKAEGEEAWEGRSECEIVQLAEQIDRYLLAEHLATAAAAQAASSAAAAKDSSAPPPKPPQPVYIPPRLLASSTPLPSSWTSYIDSLPGFPTTFKPSIAQLYSSLLPPLAPALTILSSLRRLFPSSTIDRAQSLTILLLDSTPETSKRETLALEELFHQLPSLLHVRTVTIAPQDAAVAAPKVDKEGQPLPGQEEVKVASLPLCRGCKEKGRERTIEHFKSLDDPSFSLSPAITDAEDEELSAITDAEDEELSEGEHLTLALAWNTSLALCMPPSPSSSSDETPTDTFWSSSVLRPLAHLASSSSSPSFPIGLVIAAQTREDLSSSLSFARSVLGVPPSSSAWKEEKNVWRDPRPRVEGWWDHRPADLLAKGGVEKRDEDGGVSWAGGWCAGLRLAGGEGGKGGRGEEKVGR